MPPQKLQALKRTVATCLGIEAENLTKTHLEQAARLGEGSLPSERICEAACSDNASLRAFLRTWRELFVKSLEPKFLAEGWGVDCGLDDGRFVPSVANVVSWPGDWFCGDCGVHCFCRSDKCR